MSCNQLSPTIVAALALGFGFAAYAQEPQAGAQDPVASPKQSVHQGLVKVHQYEWVETNIIRLKGEEKGRTQNRRYMPPKRRTTQPPRTSPS